MKRPSLIASVWQWYTPSLRFRTLRRIIRHRPRSAFLRTWQNLFDTR